MRKEASVFGKRGDGWKCSDWEVVRKKLER